MTSGSMSKDVQSASETKLPIGRHLVCSHNLTHLMGNGKSFPLIPSLPDTERGDNMILTVVDTFTKMVHLIPCHESADAQRVATLLFTHVFKHHGAPLKIISERDPRWSNEVFHYILSHFGSTHAMSTTHHPQTDGLTERMN